MMSKKRHLQSPFFSRLMFEFTSRPLEGPFLDLLLFLVCQFEHHSAGVFGHIWWTSDTTICPEKGPCKGFFVDSDMSLHSPQVFLDTLCGLQMQQCVQKRRLQRFVCLFENQSRVVTRSLVWGCFHTYTYLADLRYDNVSKRDFCEVV